MWCSINRICARTQKRPNGYFAVIGYPGSDDGASFRFSIGDFAADFLVGSYSGLAAGCVAGMQAFPRDSAHRVVLAGQIRGGDAHPATG